MTYTYNGWPAHLYELHLTAGRQLRTSWRKARRLLLWFQHWSHPPWMQWVLSWPLERTRKLRLRTSRYVDIFACRDWLSLVSTYSHVSCFQSVMWYCQQCISYQSHFSPCRLMKKEVLQMTKRFHRCSILLTTSQHWKPRIGKRSRTWRSMNQVAQSLGMKWTALSFTDHWKSHGQTPK